MMNSFEKEKMSFEFEVEAEAVRLIRDGLAAPFDAIEQARDFVMRRRRKLSESATSAGAVDPQGERVTGGPRA